MFMHGGIYPILLNLVSTSHEANVSYHLTQKPQTYFRINLVDNIGRTDTVMLIGKLTISWRSLVMSLPCWWWRGNKRHNYGMRWFHWKLRDTKTQVSLVSYSLLVTCRRRNFNCVVRTYNGLSCGSWCLCSKLRRSHYLVPTWRRRL